jgi:hypothetical protein
MIYVACTPTNKLDKKNRVSGWRHVPLEHKAKYPWRMVIAQAKGLVQHVVSSDLDGEAANLAGNELGVPVKAEYGLRRFNIGRLHAKDAAVVDRAIRTVEEKWLNNPDIPIREGDSLTSLRKRFVQNFEKLLESGNDVLFVSDARTIQFIRANFDPHGLIPNGNPLRTDRVFKVQKNGNRV